MWMTGFPDVPSRLRRGTFCGIFVRGIILVLAFSVRPCYGENSPHAVTGAVIGKAARTNIYHHGWIDLNKTGHEETYENPHASIKARVNDLLARMTLREKVGQLGQVGCSSLKNAGFIQSIRRGLVGALVGYAPGAYKFFHRNFGHQVRQRNELQRIAVEQSRLGIPLLFGYDSIHGFRTEFPMNIGLSCTWNPRLVREVFRVNAAESAAVGINWVFTPMVNIARDPRWGRIAEGFGEDPFLTSILTVAAVHGTQNINPHSAGRVAACIKHYLAYGVEEGGRDYGVSNVTRYTLRNVYMPAYRAGVKAGAMSVMAAFNSIGGIPCTDNQWAIRHTLLRKWCFKGLVVSDATAIADTMTWGYARDRAEAARLALKAGVDMEMGLDTYRTIPGQIKDGTISVHRLNEAVRRVLRVKFKLGLFNHPYTNPQAYKTAFFRPHSVALALKAAEESCVLLKNANGILPLGNSIHKIALIGPFANDRDDMLGCWSAKGSPKHVVSLASGIRKALPKGDTLSVISGDSKAQRTQAGEIAKKADVVLLALGEPAGWSGEDNSVVSLRLSKRQRQLFQVVAATGRPIVLLLFAGRTLAFPTLNKESKAVVFCWYPGDGTGTALANILFGKFNPCGRLSVDIPQATGQIPLYYDHDSASRMPFAYIYRNGPDANHPTLPLYPFGYGLSYTSYRFSPVALSSGSINRNQTLTASATITNTGDRTGTEVIQLYIRDVASPMGVRPVRQLAGFQRIHLKPGQSRTVHFVLNDKLLGYYGTNGKWTLNSGHYQVWISPYSALGIGWISPDLAPHSGASFLVHR